MRDVVIRSAKTFVQTFMATFVLSLSGGTADDLAVWRRAALAATAAGISAVWNGVLKVRTPR